MTNFEQHKKNEDEWYALPVYTHHQGYKICLKVYANGRHTGEGSHVSAFIHFMRGEFDDSLKWPFRGDISFRLLDQLEDKDHITETNKYTVNTNYCSRVTGKQMGRGYGRGMFIAHTELKPKYLRNDTLLFQIHQVDLHQ